MKRSTRCPSLASWRKNPRPSTKECSGATFGSTTVVFSVANAVRLRAWLGGRFLSMILFETSPHDPLILGGISAFLAAIALVASYLPARRATRVDPVAALRYE